MNIGYKFKSVAYIGILAYRTTLRLVPEYVFAANRIVALCFTTTIELFSMHPFHGVPKTYTDCKG